MSNGDRTAVVRFTTGTPGGLERWRIANDRFDVAEGDFDVHRAGANEGGLLVQLHAHDGGGASQRAQVNHVAG